MSKWSRRGGGSDDDEGSYYSSEDGEICPRCRQEYTGTCLLNIPECPFEEKEEDPFADDEDKGPDFEDVPDLDKLLDEDEEAEKLVEEEADNIPIEDLLDDEKSADETHA